jgi:hypothetical protein
MLNKNYMRDWRQRNRDKCHVYDRKYRITHPEIINAIRRRYYHNHIEKRRAYARTHDHSAEWNVKHAELRWAIAGLSRHRHQGYIIQMKSKELEKLLKETQTCRICGQPLTVRLGEKQSPSMDIIDPNNKILSAKNVQIVCFQCNSTKRDRTMQEFIEYCKLVSERFC